MSFFGAKNRLAHHDHNDLKIDRINITLKLLVNNLELTFLHTKCLSRAECLNSGTPLLSASAGFISGTSQADDRHVDVGVNKSGFRNRGKKSQKKK